MSPTDPGARDRRDASLAELHGGRLEHSEADDGRALAEFADEASTLSQLLAAAANSAREDAERAARTRVPVILWVGAAIVAGILLGTTYSRFTRPVSSPGTRDVAGRAPVVAPVGPSAAPVEPRPSDAAPDAAGRRASTPAVAPAPARAARALPVTAPPARVPEDAAASASPIIVTVPDAPVPTLESEPVAAAEDDAIVAAPAPVATAAALDVATDERDIRQLLEAYEQSYDRLDAVSAAMLWPGVDTGALSRAFSTLASQNVAFDHCALDVLGARATALCNGSLRYVRRVGNPAPQSRPLAWTFELDRSAGRWLITRVTAR